MNIRLAPLLTVLLGFYAPLAQAGNGWSTVAYPLAGPPQVIGSYAAGCIAGAGALFAKLDANWQKFIKHPRVLRSAGS